MIYKEINEEQGEFIIGFDEESEFTEEMYNYLLEKLNEPKKFPV